VWYKEGIWSELNNWCLKKTVRNLATMEGEWVVKSNAHVIVFVESVVWRYAAFTVKGGGEGEDAIDLFSSSLL
jgi:hypothetical protein